MKRAKEICPTTTMGKIEEGALLVDVRRRREVEQVRFDVPECIHIPLAELEERIGEIPRDRAIVMVCHSGSRSLKTTYYLMNAGYENVMNMTGGILQWAKKGFPLKGDAASLLEAARCDCSQPDCC